MRRRRRPMVRVFAFLFAASLPEHIVASLPQHIVLTIAALIADDAPPPPDEDEEARVEAERLARKAKRKVDLFCCLF
jgi:hypothetical protein